MPVPAPWIRRPIRRTAKAGDQAQRSVPKMNREAAAMNSVRSLKRLFKKDDVGRITARTSRYPVVIHCTVDVVIPNSLIRVGKVTFIDVSTMIPQKEVRPVAIIDKISFGVILRSNSIAIKQILSVSDARPDILRHMHLLINP